MQSREPKKNASLTAARLAKNDEFYTRIEDIENELKHYKQHFKGKVVFCNCDDPAWSNFWKYFHAKFDALGLKRLVATHYKGEPSYVLSCDGTRDAAGQLITVRTDLEQGGDFRSAECVALLDEADIVCTNPPFSLFREFVALLMAKQKRFIIIGSQNAVSTKELFPLIKGNAVWLGVSKPKSFTTPGGGVQKLGNVCWYTNLRHRRRNEEIVLFRKSNDAGMTYPEFTHYNAINVDKVQDIPMDHRGPIGVPITFVEKYNPDQFEILDANEHRRHDSVPTKPHGLIKDQQGAIGDRIVYARLLVRLKSTKEATP